MTQFSLYIPKLEDSTEEYCLRLMFSTRAYFLKEQSKILSGVFLPFKNNVVFQLTPLTDEKMRAFRVAQLPISYFFNSNKNDFCLNKRFYAFESAIITKKSVLCCRGQIPRLLGIRVFSW